MHVKVMQTSYVCRETYILHYSVARVLQLEKWLNPDLNPNPDVDLPTIVSGHVFGYLDGYFGR